MIKHKDLYYYFFNSLLNFFSFSLQISQIFSFSNIYFENPPDCLNFNIRESILLHVHGSDNHYYLGVKG